MSPTKNSLAPAASPRLKLVPSSAPSVAPSKVTAEEEQASAPVNDTTVVKVKFVGSLKIVSLRCELLLMRVVQVVVRVRPTIKCFYLLILGIVDVEANYIGMCLPLVND
ncbi:hypothetical protein ABZP36_028026 [Zizania latifolia]